MMIIFGFSPIFLLLAIPIGIGVAVLFFYAVKDAKDDVEGKND